jgi:1,6-anhydro-N-acetylmuramate kinase
MAGPGNPLAERRVVEHLRKYRAVHPDKTMGYAPMRWTHARALARLRAADVVKGGDGALWLDEAAWDEWRAKRRKRAMVVLAVGGVGAAIAALTTLRG